MPSLLGDDVPQYKRDFRLKLIDFRGQTSMRLNQTGFVPINVRRSNLFEDAYTEIMTKTPEQLKKRLKITFEGEIGEDFGGVSRFVPIIIVGMTLTLFQRVLFPTFARNV